VLEQFEMSTRDLRQLSDRDFLCALCRAYLSGLCGENALRLAIRQRAHPRGFERPLRDLDQVIVMGDENGFPPLCLQLRPLSVLRLLCLESRVENLVRERSTATKCVVIRTNAVEINACLEQGTEQDVGFIIP
jgi:hypothetical protein